MKRKFLIFGGSGFIGEHLTSYLHVKKEEVKIYDIKRPQKEDQLKYKMIDIRNPISITEDFGSYDIIINLAAIHKTPGHSNHEYFDTNINGAKNICDFAREKKINTILFTSSISIYGTYEDKKSEDTLPMPDVPYGISKLTAEYIHKEWYAEDDKNRRLIILRPGVVFGKNERGNFTRLVNSLQKKYFAYVGRKDVRKACIYVKDLVDVIYKFSIDNELKNETFNISYNPSDSIERIVSIISKKGKMNFPRFVIPKSIIIFISSILFYIFRKKDFNILRMKKLVISNNIDSNKLNDRYKLKIGFEEAIEDWMSETDFIKNKKIY